MRRFLLALAFSLICINVFASELELIKITNNHDNEHSVFSITTNDNNEILTFSQTGFIKNTQIYKHEYVIEDAYNGVTLHERQGRSIVDLKTDNLTDYNGGHFTITYKLNAITGTYKQAEIELTKLQGEWKILHQNKVVKDMHCLVNKKPIVGAVGIRSIQFNYAEQE